MNRCDWRKYLRLYGAGLQPYMTEEASVFAHGLEAPSVKAVSPVSKQAVQLNSGVVAIKKPGGQWRRIGASSALSI